MIATERGTSKVEIRQGKINAKDKFPERYVITVNPQATEKSQKKM